MVVNGIRAILCTGLLPGPYQGIAHVPYYVHKPEYPPGHAEYFANDGRVYTSASEAGQSKQSGEVLTFLANEDEINAWRDREYTRIESGQYVGVPFFDGMRLVDEYRDHYVHLAITKPGMLAYTKTIQHGIEDRQTIIRPGKYLQTYYSQLSPSVIAQYAGLVTAESVQLHFARTPDEIETAYTASHGSCMYTGKAHLRDLPQQPVRAYGDSDLAVAYTGPIDNVTARCIVWPERFIYNRPYGHTSLIEALLQSAGYKQGRIEDARIRAIKYRRGSWIVPYVDGVSRGTLSDCGKYIVLDDTGPIDCHNTSGIANENVCSNCNEACGDDSLCEDCQENTFSCEDCGNRFNNDDSNYVEDCGDYCNRCYSRRFTSCEACGNTIAQDDSHTVDGNDYCSDCYSERFTVCEHCSEDTAIDNTRSSECTGETYCEECWSAKDRVCQMVDCDTEWNEYDVFSDRQRRDRKQSKTDDICEACADRFCHICESTHDPEDCATIADAESDGFGIACYDPDGTPWQIGLPLGPVETIATPPALADPFPGGASYTGPWYPAPYGSNVYQSKLGACDVPGPRLWHNLGTYPIVSME
jgi:hypothetical protein